MKKIFLSVLTLATLAACEKDLPGYSSDDCRLNFVIYDIFTPTNRVTTEEVAAMPSLTESSFSFVYGDKTADTLWFEVETMGHLSTVDRPISLVQVATGDDDAVAGKHYVAFDNPQLCDRYYFIPANSSTAKVPIVLLRDPSLKEKEARLVVTFAANGRFTTGYPAFSTRTITISDRLAKPSNWTELMCDFYFGEYSTLKHQLMIEWTGRTWDDDDLESVMKGDQAYLMYLCDYFVNKLDEENAKRAEQGLDNYQVNGVDIKFSM